MECLLDGWIVEERNSPGIGDYCKAGQEMEERGIIKRDEIKPRSDKGEEEA